MGIKIKKEYPRAYIRFEHVLKKNFLLQEEVSQLYEQLSAALSLVSEKERQIEEHIVDSAKRTEEMKQVIRGAQEVVNVNNEKTATIEDIVKTIEREKQKNKEVYQENIKLSVKLRESETNIKALRKKLEEYESKDMEEKLYGDKLSDNYQKGVKRLSEVSLDGSSIDSSNEI